MAFLVSAPVVSRILWRRGLPTRLIVLTLTTRTFHNSSTAVRISVFVESLLTRNVYILLRSTKCVAFSVTCALRITLYTLNALDSSVATIRLPYQQASSHYNKPNRPATTHTSTHLASRLYPTYRASNRFSAALVITNRFRLRTLKAFKSSQGDNDNR